VNSIDINLDYKWKWNGIGKFDITSAWTYYERYTIQLVPSEPYYNYVATATGENGTTPRWRSYTTVDWKNFGFDVFTGVTYVAAVQDQGAGGDDVYGLEHVGSFFAFDAGVSYDFSHLHFSKYTDGLKVTIGCNNFMNRMPPLAESAFPDTNADVGTYDGAIGRMWYVNASYSF
jgi:hypothetical protein